MKQDRTKCAECVNGCSAEGWYVLRFAACSLLCHHACWTHQSSNPPVKIQLATGGMTGTTVVAQMLCKGRYFFLTGGFWDVPSTAICCLHVCHGGSLHVPDRLICAGAWHGKYEGSWHGHSCPNQDCPKPTVLIRIMPIISLFCSLYFPPLTSLPPMHSLSSSLLLFLLTLHSSIATLKPTKKKRGSTLAGSLPCCHFFSFVPSICCE